MADTDGDTTSQASDASRVRCSNCGTENESSDRYCANCGMPLAVAPTIPTQYATPETSPTSPTSPPDDEWRMSNLGPPPARRRRLWLWILIGLLTLCVLTCVGLVIFASTATGSEWLNDLSTRVAEQATEAAQ